MFTTFIDTSYKTKHVTLNMFIAESEVQFMAIVKRTFGEVIY